MKADAERGIFKTRIRVRVVDKGRHQLVEEFTETSATEEMVRKCLHNHMTNVAAETCRRRLWALSPLMRSQFMTLWTTRRIYYARDETA